MRDTTNTTIQPSGQVPARATLETLDKIREVKADWLYQLCGAEARARLLAERVPATSHLREVALA